jgi:hypothetical protein
MDIFYRVWGSQSFGKVYLIWYLEIAGNRIEAEIITLVDTCFRGLYMFYVGVLSRKVSAGWLQFSVQLPSDINTGSNINNFLRHITTWKMQIIYLYLLIFFLSLLFLCVLFIYSYFLLNKLMLSVPVTVAVLSDAWVLVGWLLGEWVRIPLKTWMFVRVFLCCVVLCR